MGGFSSCWKCREEGREAWRGRSGCGRQRWAAMHPKRSCKCRHCGEFFVPDVRNRSRQRYCEKAPCRKARKADSQRRWLKQPGNSDYFRGADNAARARQWQAAHPGYWKKRRRKRRVVLQDRLNAQPAGDQDSRGQDAAAVLQDVLAAQSPVVVGLIAHLAGSVLQDDIAQMTRRLHSRGRAVLGKDVPRPAYGKTLNRHRSGAACAAPV